MKSTKNRDKFIFFALYLKTSGKVGTVGTPPHRKEVRMTKIHYQCSSCGKTESVRAMVGIPHGMFGLGYRAVGDALYCPDCVKSWEERNGVPFDEQYTSPGTLFARWWNRKVEQAVDDKGRLQKYRMNAIGDYELVKPDKQYDTMVCTAVKRNPYRFVDILIEEAGRPENIEIRMLLLEAACVIAHLLDKGGTIE